VAISYCNYRRGPAAPSLFIDDIPAQHRVTAWLHQLTTQRVRRIGRGNAAELLQRS
jgi:hypothetical protein